MAAIDNDPHLALLMEVFPGKVLSVEEPAADESDELDPEGMPQADGSDVIQAPFDPDEGPETD